MSAGRGCKVSGNSKDWLPADMVEGLHDVCREAYILETNDSIAQTKT